MQATQTAAPAATIIDQQATHHAVVAQPAARVAPITGTVITPSDLLRIAMERNDGDLDRLERLMAMDRQWRADRAKEAFNEDFSRFKALNIVVPKNKLVKQRAKSGGPGPTYYQSEYETVANLLQPALARCGFGYRFDVKFERGENGGVPWCYVTCILEHRMGHAERLTLGGPPDDSGAKNPLQEMQSSSTFLMRHSLLSITGTAQAGKDNDGRGSRGYREDGEGEGEGGDGGGAPQASPLTQRGQEEAMNGTKALNAWWGSLTAKDRNTLQAEFGGWLKCARQADARGQS